MTYYPIMVDLTGKQCVVVGAGHVAERKVMGLLVHTANVLLVAPSATAGLEALAWAGRITWVRASYQSAHLEDAFLVIAATDLDEVNEAVVRDARARNILVCRTDVPNEGNFVTPAQVVRGDLILAVSTSGSSPTLAAVLREDLDALYGPEWEQMTELFGALRDILK